MHLGALEIGLIIAAIVLIFGVGKLGQLGGALGKSIREFRRERDKTDDIRQSTAIESSGEKNLIQSAAASPKREMFCSNCGKKIAENAKFCMECGAKTGNQR